MASHLDSTFGAAFVGLIIAAMLHGVSCVQALYYFTHQKDGWPIKLLVSTVMFFDTIHQALITHTVYTYTVTNWGDPADLQKLVWSIIVEVLFNGFTALLVQSFLAIRVWRLTTKLCHNWLLAGKGRIALISVVALLVIGEFTCVLVYTIDALHFETIAQLRKLKVLSILVNALAAAGDILIAATLCTILHFSRTGFHRSDSMINKLILFAVSTGFLTSICAVASLISTVVAGNTFIYIAFFFCIGRLYTNSLLATLNARKSIRILGGGTQDVCENLSWSVREFPPSRPMSTMDPIPISIKVDTTTEFAADLDE